MYLFDVYESALSSASSLLAMNLLEQVSVSSRAKLLVIMLTFIRSTAMTLYLANYQVS